MIVRGVAHFRSALTSLTLRPERSRHECLALLLFMWVPMARMREPKPVGEQEGRRKMVQGRRKEGGRDNTRGSLSLSYYYEALTVAFSWHPLL